MQKKSSRATPPFWRNRKVMPVISQIAFLMIVLTILYYFISNANTGLKQFGMSLGFGFLENNASFSISEALIEYTPTDSYGRAILVGILNTLRIAFFGIIFASMIGLTVGIARLSNNWLLSKIAWIYVEVFRNTPLLVQIFIWYFAVFLTLPKIEEAVKVGPAYFSNRGSAIPWFEGTGGGLVWGLLFVIGVIVAIVIYRLLMKKQIENGKRMYPLVSSFLILGLAGVIAFVISGTGPFSITLPSIDGKVFIGGLRVSPEYLSILFALVIYTSTFIAEIVRAGIQGVEKGQIEASKALGFKESTSLRLVVFPQAIRIIIPPLTSQYLNLTKNSSLAVAVGYQEVVSIGNTIMNQSGRTIEMILVMITVYLIFSLTTSLIMNIFNNKFQLVER